MPILTILNSIPALNLRVRVHMRLRGSQKGQDGSSLPGAKEASLGIVNEG